MTIDEAITILQNISSLTNTAGPDVRMKAFRLGRDALKTIKELRNYPFPDGVVQLPGETLPVKDN